MGMLADPLESPQTVLAVDLNFMSFVGIHRGTRRVVAGLTVVRVDGQHHVGGVVHHTDRGQGYGRETLRVVCTLMHRHFGVGRLVAGCETSNMVSQRWLAGTGFTIVDGPPTHTLPNGRVIRSLWWERRDPGARLACQRLRVRRWPGRWRTAVPRGGRLGT
jgi:RimJ/RimL family protein N-acetyltransferase